MSKTITVKWPLKQEDNGGFDGITEEEFAEAVKFSIKNVVLTVPGEKISDPEFGVGLRMYLFSQSSAEISSLRRHIIKQIRKYVPYLSGFEVLVDSSRIDQKSLAVRISFEVSRKNIKDFLDIIVSV